MTTLVTGANGGLGRLLGPFLRAAGSDEVFMAGRRDCDVTDVGALRAALLKLRPRLVFHLASSFANEFAGDFQVNAQAAWNIMRLVEELRIDARVVLLGSAAEYGAVTAGENPLREDHPLRPVTVYGLTKSIQTQMATYSARAMGADVVIARMFNLLAPGLAERLFVGRMERLLERYQCGDIRVIDVGNLANFRDYVSPEEALPQLMAIAEHGVAGEVYHVASGRPMAVREVLHAMLDRAGIPRDVVTESVPNAGGRGGYDVPVIFADMTKTRALMAANP